MPPLNWSQYLTEQDELFFPNEIHPAELLPLNAICHTVLQDPGHQSRVVFWKQLLQFWPQLSIKGVWWARCRGVLAMRAKRSLADKWSLAWTLLSAAVQITRQVFYHLWREASLKEIIRPLITHSAVGCAGAEPVGQPNPSPGHEGSRGSVDPALRCQHMPGKGRSQLVPTPSKTAALLSPSRAPKA